MKFFRRNPAKVQARKQKQIKFKKEEQKTKKYITPQAKILTIFSMISLIGSALGLLLMLFGFLIVRVVVPTLLMILLFVMTSYRMIKIIIDNEERHDNH